MISLHNVSKHYQVGNAKKIIANSICLEIEKGKSVGLLGKNGAGKSTLLRMIAGIELPTSGHILHQGTTSWPVGFSGSFHPELSAAQNIRFVARIYGVEPRVLIDFVREFSELGIHFNEPFRTYSAGMKARLAFGLSLGIKFDTYLIDEVTAVGDVAFRERSSALLRDRLSESGAIVVSHSISDLKRMCNSAIVLINGKAKMFDDLDNAIIIHQRAMSGIIPEWAI